MSNLNFYIVNNGTISNIVTLDDMKKHDVKALTTAILSSLIQFVMTCLTPSFRHSKKQFFAFGEKRIRI